MSALGQTETKRDLQSSAVRSTATHRRRLLHILFVQRDAANVKRCLQELKRVQFKVNADVVLTPEQFAERLRSQPYDVVVAEYPSPNWRGTQALELLHQMEKQIPLIFVTETLQPETVAEFTTKGAADCIEMDRIGHLPVGIRRALDEKNLRDERDRAEKELRHSEAHYRALVGNLTYGICRCTADGRFLDVNQALVTMLGYTSREQLLAVNLASDIIQDPCKRAQLLGHSGQEEQAEPVEIGWKRKDGTTLKVRLSGREVSAEPGALDGYEIIAEDVTKQRELEDHLRQQAARDSLTGLANYRQLVDVLDAEIRRSKRTGREFVLLLLDLDGLKQVNDRHGHLAGSNALCRLADVLCNCSRSIDTAARFGGDEFALVLPETGAKAAILVARRICDRCASDGKEPGLSVSLGIAVYPQDGETIETLLRTADRELYRMKRREKRVFSVGL